MLGSGALATLLGVSNPAGGQMTQAKLRDRIYRGRRFEGEIIELLIRWSAVRIWMKMLRSAV